MRDAKTSDLIGVDWGVIQLDAMTEGFIDNQNACLVGGRVIPGCCSGHNWHIREGFDRFIMGTNINASGCECKDDKVIAKAASVCIGIGFVRGLSPWPRL